MAGSEKTGYENSRFDLFNNASVIITPNRFNQDESIKRAECFWEMNCARTYILSATLHDIIISYTSHLPHMIACSLVNLLKDFIDDDMDGIDVRSLIGSGFRDVTRISSGSPEMWSDISLLNRENIYKSITKLIEKLQLILEMFDQRMDVDKVREFFKNVREYRLGL